MRAPSTGLLWPALAAAGANVLWGLTFLLGKVALEALPVTSIILLRFSFAALTLLPFALWRGRRPRRQDLPLFLLTGALQVPITYLLQYTGLSLTSASSAALILGAVTPLLAIGAWPLLAERPHRRTWVAIGVSSLGLLLIVGVPGPGRSVLGDALVLLSTVAATASILLTPRLIRHYGPVNTTAWTLTCATLLTLPLALGSGAPHAGIPPNILGSLLFLGVVCTALTLVLWNWSVARSSAAFAGMFVNIEPLVGTVLGVMILHERLGPFTWVGGGLILGAATMMTLWGQRQAVPVAQALHPEPGLSTQVSDGVA